jgi:hypothetical protein
MIKTIATLALFATACAGAPGQGVFYTIRTDTPIPDLVPIAEATARASGYTIAVEDLSDGFDKAFVAVRPDGGDAMLVQVANKVRMVQTTKVCTRRCNTTFMVTPVSYANQKLTVIDPVSADDEARARDLLSALSSETMRYRNLEIQ